MFETLMALIALEGKTACGSTGYLDQAIWSPPIKGVDAYNRPFFSLPLRTFKEDWIGDQKFEKTNVGMVTFFKRYTDPTHHVWVCADSSISGKNAEPLVGGAISNPDNGDVEELMEKLVRGEEVEFIYGRNYVGSSKYIRRSRLLTKEELTEEIRKFDEEMARIEAEKKAAADAAKQ